MTLTRADVAHLKAGDEVTAKFTDGTHTFTITGEAYMGGQNLVLGGWVLRMPTEIGKALVDVVSPKPPVLRMDEPTWPGAVVMDGHNLGIRQTRSRWYFASIGWVDWVEIQNPRPLTDAERREYGIPETVPPGHVAVRVDDIDDTVVGEATRGRSFTSDECQEFEASMALLAARAAIAIKAQREAE